VIVHDSARGLHFDEDELVHDQVGAILTHDDVVEHHIDPGFHLHFRAERPQSMRECPLVNVLQKAVPQLVVHVEEGS
jgi:hypothetical protein